MTPVPLASGANLTAAFVTVFLTSLSIAALWFLMFARAKSASVLRGMFGIINVLLFFPSGALYPIESYPEWLAKLSTVDPLTYGVRALRNLILRGAAPSSAYADWVFLLTFTLVAGVLTAAMTMISPGISRMWAGLIGVLVFGAVLLWFRSRLTEPAGVVLGRLRESRRGLVVAAYLTFVSPLFLVLYAAVGGLPTLLIGMVLAAVAEFLMVTSRR